MKRAPAILLFIALILLAGCTGTPATGGDTSGTAPAEVTPTASAPAYVLDTSVRPGDDFYAYVNNAWIRDHPIPPDKELVSALGEMGDTAETDLWELTLRAENASPETADRNRTLIGQFYRSGMDTATIEREGLLPLHNDLAMIDAIDSRAGLTNATIVLLAEGSGPLYYYSAEINPRNSSEIIPGMYQGGLGLPDRDYYFRNDAQSKELRDAYLAHIARVFVLSGEPEEKAAADAATVYSMETAIARSHFTPEENRIPEDTTNLYDIPALAAKYPAIGWESLGAINGSGPVRVVNIHQPRFVQGLDELLATAPLDDWKAYLRYRLVDDASPYLSAPFENENFAFYGTTLAGMPVQKPRWKRVIATESELMPDLVGRAYVADYVDPRTRGMVAGIFASTRTSLDARLANVSWMENGTRERAREKLAAMGEKIAYPDRWMDYAGLALSGSYLGNVRAATAYSFIHGPDGLATIGRPVDRSAWFISPQTVNAYYDPTRNEIVFPAAILQPPFFDPAADPAQNYGGIGVIIGHELTHGFDDQGRQYDKDGNLRDWWTESDARNFNDRTAVLVDQYNRYEILPGLYNNGNLTLGENIADFGGLTVAYHAWKDAGPTPGSPAPAGTDREFFYSAATIWRGNFTEEYLRYRVYTNPHTAGRYRVDGAVADMPEFYAAFPEVGPGDALYRNTSERPVIW